MAYTYETDSGGQGHAGEPSHAERENGKEQTEEWDPDRETWAEFQARTK